LSSKTLGTLTFGVIDSPLKTSTGPIAVFTNTLADYRTLFTTNATSQRPESSVLYVSPTMGGFVARAMYAARNEAGNSPAFSDPSLYSVSATYTQGPFFAVLAAENTKAVNSGGIAAANAVPLSFTSPGIALVNASAATGAVTSTRASRVGFGYTLGNAKFGVAMENNDVSAGADGKKSLNVRSYYVTGSYQMGLNSIKAAITTREDNKAHATTPNENGATQLTIGMDRAMSKRTTVYALATRVQNDTNGSYALGGGATGIASVGSAKDKSARGIVFGMSHVF